MRRSATRSAALCAALLLAACERGPVPETPPRQVSESPFQYPEELWDAAYQATVGAHAYSFTTGPKGSA